MTSRPKSNLQDRLNFAGFAPETLTHIKQSCTILAPHLDTALDAFYAHLNRFPALKDKFSSPERMKFAHDAQKVHWQNMLSANYDDSYAESTRRIGLAHHRIGLTPSTYIGGYNFVTSHLIRALFSEARDKSTGFFNKKTDLNDLEAKVDAVVKAVLIDIDLAITVYLLEGEKSRDLLLDEVANGISQSSSNIQMVAAAVEEMSRSYEAILQKVDSIVLETEQSSTMVDSARAETSNLIQAAHDIVQVVKLIRAVASKTNLLALNATIESARAGEAGKGFGVVAHEVKQLANQTASATENIDTCISNISSVNEKFVHVINGIVGAVEQISKRVENIKIDMDEQKIALSEINRSIESSAQQSKIMTKSLDDIRTQRAS